MPHKKVIEDGYSVKEAAFSCGCELSGRCNVKTKTERLLNNKITREIADFVEESIELNLLLTILQIQERIKNVFSINLFLVFIRRIIYKLQITLKKGLASGFNELFTSLIINSVNELTTNDL
ncbi:unnamed protein product [Schistosoma margrebowiei]|uniref:Uncharacterized protein n=1 Tax=Schistosoma margrebowiei TaxID=48269 RepID=A0A183MC32_9TREM|nr:unnamed protein product [Schistosoma margrebowiei]